MKPHVTNNSGNDEWYTPPHIIEAARATMGLIHLDPASSDKANSIVQASYYYTIEENGLCAPWIGNVWLNPPYSRGKILPFAEKLVAEVENKHVKQACVIVNNATETKWFQRILSVSSAVCLLKGRVKFLDCTLQPKKTPLQGQAVLYVGPEWWDFTTNFARYGAILHHIGENQ